MDIEKEIQYEKCYSIEMTDGGRELHEKVLLVRDFWKI